MLYLAHMTAAVSAFFTTIFMKGLHVFHFIDWRPTAFLTIVDEPFLRYVAFAFLVYVFVFVVFIASTVIRYSAVAAFLMACVTVFVVECVVLQQKIAFETISIGFFALTIVMYRFIMETASFHKRQTLKKSS